MNTRLIIFLSLMLGSCSVDEIPVDDVVVECSVSLEIKNDWKMASDVIYLINIHRNSLGIDTLKTNRGLAFDLAIGHNSYMMDQGMISHDNFEQRAVALAQDGADAVAENEAFGQDSAQDIVTSWINSPPHLDTIEGNYTDISVAITKNVYGYLYVTMIATRI